MFVQIVIAIYSRQMVEWYMFFFPFCTGTAGDYFEQSLSAYRRSVGEEDPAFLTAQDDFCRFLLLKGQQEVRRQWHCFVEIPPMCHWTIIQMAEGFYYLRICLWVVPWKPYLGWQVLVIISTCWSLCLWDISNFTVAEMCGDPESFTSLQKICIRWPEHRGRRHLSVDRKCGDDKGEAQAGL